MDSEDLAAFDFLVGAMPVFLLLFFRESLGWFEKGAIGPFVDRCERLYVQLDRKFPAEDRSVDPALRLRSSRVTQQTIQVRA